VGLPSVAGGHEVVFAEWASARRRSSQRFCCNQNPWVLLQCRVNNQNRIEIDQALSVAQLRGCKHPLPNVRRRRPFGSGAESSNGVDQGKRHFSTRGRGRLEGILKRPLIARYAGPNNAIHATCGHARPVLIRRNETRALSFTSAAEVNSGTLASLCFSRGQSVGDGSLN
jgi:hypothetical protein